MENILKTVQHDFVKDYLSSKKCYNLFINWFNNVIIPFFPPRVDVFMKCSMNDGGAGFLFSEKCEILDESSIEAQGRLTSWKRTHLILFHALFNREPYWGNIDI